MTTTGSETLRCVRCADLIPVSDVRIRGILGRWATAHSRDGEDCGPLDFRPRVRRAFSKLNEELQWLDGPLNLNINHDARSGSLEVALLDDMDELLGTLTIRR